MLGGKKALNYCSPQEGFPQSLKSAQFINLLPSLPPLPPTTLSQKDYSRIRSAQLPHRNQTDSPMSPVGLPAVHFLSGLF